MTRNYTIIDRALNEFDNFQRSVFGKACTTRSYPAQHTPENTLNFTEKKQSAALMRINHTGEVCAQALYRGQALLARNPKIKQILEQSGHEETDHLAWCQQRLEELSSHRSYLNVFWYWSSFFIGLLAAASGDQWSLGFVEETEKQVERHLDSHLEKLASADKRSEAVIAQMKLDEIHHGQNAHHAGAAELPELVKQIMALQSKVMTSLAYYI